MNSVLCLEMEKKRGSGVCTLQELQIINKYNMLEINYLQTIGTIVTTHSCLWLTLIRLQGYTFPDLVTYHLGIKSNCISVLWHIVGYATSNTSKRECFRVQGGFEQ